jgi:hypothetical protein
MLFLTVSGGGYANYYFELWNSLTNDGAKRNILMAAAKASLNVALERDKKAYEEVKWILDRTRELAGIRNTVTHASLTSTPTASNAFPNAWPGDRLAQRLEGYDLLAEYRRLRDAAILLRDYAGRVAQALARERPAWPDRPNLPVQPKPITTVPLE